MWSPSLRCLLLGFNSVFSLVLAANITTLTLDNNIQYKFDTNGNAIDSTSGKIDFLAGTYIWYGLSNTCGSVFCGIISYSSPDLQTWTPNGFLFDPSTTEIQALCAPPLSGNCGRPHIVFNPSTATYVLWVNAGAPGFRVFTSTEPTRGYVLVEERALVGYQPTEGGPWQTGDFSVAVIDGKGWLAYSLIDFSTLGASVWPPFRQSTYFQELTPDFMNTTGEVSHVVSATEDLVDYESESPEIFKRGDYYYVITSNTCGFCTGTLLNVYRTTNTSGPWVRQIISSTTCGGQSTGVLTLPNPNSNSSTYLHQADIVRSAPITGTRTATHAHQFLALEFSDDGSLLDLNCSASKKVDINIVPGLSVRSNSTTPPTLSSPNPITNVYIPACLLPTYQLYQTFTATSSGNLKTISLNLASLGPSLADEDSAWQAIGTGAGNLSITVFKYENNTNFYTPFYVWETLATLSVPPRKLGWAFESLSVPVGKAVTAGDKIGFALVSAGVAPLCVLVTNPSSDSSTVNEDEEDGVWRVGDFGGVRKGDGGLSLSIGEAPADERVIFAIGANQVSLRGREGKTAPVGTFGTGTELKWSAVIE